MAMICFDLDGTLMNPLPGIRHCVSTVCAERGLPAPSEAELAPQVGFGLRRIFEGILGSSDPGPLDGLMERAWSLFRDEAIYEHRLYEGVPLLLGRLKRQGHTLCVVTAKPAPMARQVLHHFDLLLLFDAVVGPGLQDAWKPKGEVMEELRSAGLFSDGGLLVGDRGGDMEAARQHGLRPLGVTWGFGSAEELRKGGAERVFDRVEDLDAFFQGTFHEPEVYDLIGRAE